jgi:RimJ/RimL family protein N-acetyltransferase
MSVAEPLSGTHVCESHRVELQLLPRSELILPIYRIASDSEISRHMEWESHSSPKATEAFFQFCLEESRAGQGFHFGAVQLDTREVLGVGSITGIVPRIDKAEVTTWISRAHWGRGWNKKIKHVLFNLAFCHLNLNKIVFRVAVDNAASNRSHQKLFTRLEGVLRQELLIQGEFKDINYYSLLKQEYLEKYGRLTVTAALDN